MKHVSLVGGLAALFLVAATPAQAQTANALPAGDGRDLVATACSQCHALTVITTLRNGPAGWKRHVYNMVLRGAQLTPREADSVLSYLSTNFGPGQKLPEAKPITLPNGPGKELVETRCGVCHDLERITAVKRQRRDWDGIVANMFERFEMPAPDDARAIASYLGTQFGSD